MEKRWRDLSLAPTRVRCRCDRTRPAGTFCTALRPGCRGARSRLCVALRARHGGAGISCCGERDGEAQARRNLAYEPRDTFISRHPGTQICGASATLGTEGLLPFGALIRAQQIVGAMERCLDHRWLRDGAQAIRPTISKFQAIQQMLADAAGQYAAASAAADLAAAAFGTQDFIFASRLRKHALAKPRQDRRNLPSGARRDGFHAGASVAFCDAAAVVLAR